MRLLEIAHPQERLKCFHYSDCFCQFTEIPVLAFFGAADTLAPFSSCKNLFNELPRSDTVTVRIYDGAFHCFDDSDLPATKFARLEVTIFTIFQLHHPM